MKFGLNDDVVKKVKSVFLKYPQIEKAVLYGSRAKGNYKIGSDIDIVLVGENVDLTIIGKIATEIDDLLLPYSFDLSAYKDISNKDLINHINRVGVEFYIINDPQ